MTVLPDQQTKYLKCFIGKMNALVFTEEKPLGNVQPEIQKLV